MTSHQSVSLPKILRPTRIVLFVQAVLSILAGVFIMALVSSFDMDDEDGAGTLIVIAVIGIVLGAILFACAVLMSRRQPGVRTTIIVVEGLNVVSGLIGLIYGITAGAVQPTVVVPIVLSLLVMRPLLRQDVREWYAGERETLVP